MKKVLLIMTALLFWNCTDYAGDWESDYGAAFGGVSGNGGYSKVAYGQMVDSRDGKSYRTIQIDNQVWMAENLNHDNCPGEACDWKGYCGSLSETCESFGRYYNWDGAMIACPSGWHLPSVAEWKSLFSVIGEDDAVTKLRAQDGWADNNGLDTYGFSMLAAGSIRDDGGYYPMYQGVHVGFWTSTGGGDDTAYLLFNDYRDNAFQFAEDPKYRGFSVRCLKD